MLNPVVRFCFKLLVGPLRKADFEAAQVPDYYITISEYAKEMIAKYYKREAAVVHPPVEVEDFKVKKQEAGNYYIVTSRQVNWKRLDLAVEACRELRRELVVIGEGPEHNNLVKLSNRAGNIKFLPLMDKHDLAEYLAGARGYLFPSMEPFGIAPVEALAVGCPVIAYGKGGARDYVREGENGLLFEKQTVKALKEAILKFEMMKFDKGKVAASVEGFAAGRFDKEIKEFVREKTE